MKKNVGGVQGRSQKFGGPSQLRLWGPTNDQSPFNPPQKEKVNEKDNKKQLIMHVHFRLSLIPFFALSQTKKTFSFPSPYFVFIILSLFL